MFNELVGEIKVCTDCMIEHANGEAPFDRPADEPAPWSAIPFGYNVTMGGEHADGCDRDGECECENLGFSWLSCDGCGSGLGGDRFLFTLWRLSADEARERFAGSLAIARDVTRTRTDRFNALVRAGEIRQYIGKLNKEQAGFARWIESHKVVA